MVVDDDDSGGVDSKVCNKTRVNYKKTLPAVGFDSPPPQAPKCLFQREEQGISPTFTSSRKIGQRDIRELFPQAQKPACGRASYSQEREGISREDRDQPAKPKDDTAYEPVRRGMRSRGLDLPTRIWQRVSRPQGQIALIWIPSMAPHPPTGAQDTGKPQQQNSLR